MVTGMAEKVDWNHANRWQKLGLIWRNRKLAKLPKTIFTYFSSSLNYFMVPGL
jgi:hypothetical protein